MHLKSLCIALLLPMAAVAAESGIVLDNFDHSVRPQDDFYRHVNGQWLKTTTIPADKSNYSSFSELSDRTEKQLLEIIREAAAHGGAGEAQQVGDLYASFMDEAAVQDAGLGPLQAYLFEIEKLSSREQIPTLMGTLEWIGAASLIETGVYADAKNPGFNTAYLVQGGLGLPDREYYLSDSDKFKSVRKAYEDYITRVLGLAGTIEARKHARAILALETRVAEKHWTKVENRDAQKTYNRRDVETINSNTPGFDLAAWLATFGVNDLETVVIQQPSYFEALGSLIDSASLETWREYFRLRLIDAYAPFLSEDFVAAHFQLHGRTILGIDSNKPRWKRGVDLVEDKLGEALGKIYVEKHFPARAKVRMGEMVDNLIEAYRQSINQLEWMGEDTRQQALDKLDSFTPKIGYPDRWRDYSALPIEADDLVGNVIRANLFTNQYYVNKLGKPVDPTEWFMTPQTVNAYYNPVANEIVFPAAILQPPFFNLEADDAVNYGGIGAVIGHEIGHGFDDQGSRFDGQGRLRNWWTDEDRNNFEARTHQLITQYNAYSPLPGYTVNGELTIGENIGDLGGLSIAAKAYHLSLKGKPAPVLDGYSGDQRLLIGWAQIWRRLYREDALINRLKTDPHSPGEYRCNGIVSNVPEFYQAFEVKPGDAMYLPPDKRVQIW